MDQYVQLKVKTRGRGKEEEEPRKTIYFEIITEDCERIQLLPKGGALLFVFLKIRAIAHQLGAYRAHESTQA